METDIEAEKGSDWPEVLRSLEATLRRLSDRVAELNERARESAAEGAGEPEEEWIDRGAARPR